jgi:alpha-glucuronidase
MQHTSEAIELQVTQEYTGQQRHLCFLTPMWKQILDFDIHVKGVSPVKTIVEGKTWRRPLGGFSAVVNVASTRTGSLIRWPWRIYTPTGGWHGIQIRVQKKFQRNGRD